MEDLLSFRQSRKQIYSRLAKTDRKLSSPTCEVRGALYFPQLSTGQETCINNDAAGLKLDSMNPNPECPTVQPPNPEPSHLCTRLSPLKARGNYASPK